MKWPPPRCHPIFKSRICHYMPGVLHHHLASFTNCVIPDPIITPSNQASISLFSIIFYSILPLPSHLRDPELSLNSFKTKLKIQFFPDPQKPHLGYIYHLILFVVRANAIIYKLARANVCIELNWIAHWNLAFPIQLVVREQTLRHKSTADPWFKKV